MSFISKAKKNHSGQFIDNTKKTKRNNNMEERVMSATKRILFMNIFIILKSH
jgi:hypothetical protein